MELEILGAPKTVRMRTRAPDGALCEAPMEVMLAALIAILEPAQKTKFFEICARFKVQHELQGTSVARVVADIEMPHIKG